MSKQNIVVIGGGTGIYPVVTALRELGEFCTCIINTSDSGGSTGRIRDEFGFPPVGDLRQSLAALADPESQAEIRDLLLYRFSKGVGLNGHNLGNLLLTAMQDLTGSTTKALEMAQSVFRIEGRVVPVSEDAYDLHVTYADGQKLRGEHELDEPNSPHQPVVELTLDPIPTLNPELPKILSDATHIIIGPGDYYASLQSVLLVPGMKEALKNSSAKIAFFVNIMTRATQTIHMTASDHVRGIEDSVGKRLDHIFINTGPIDKDELEHYAAADERPVKHDLMEDNRVLEDRFVAEAELQHGADVVARSLLRHNSDVVKKVLQSTFSL